MSKILLLAVFVVGVFAMTSVIEVSWHPERLSSVPSAVSGSMGDKSFLESVRKQGVVTKRAVELFFIEDEGQKMQLLLGFVETDTDRLKGILEKDTSRLEGVLPQAELLLKSVQAAKEHATEASEEVLANNRVKSAQAIQGAQTVLDDLKEVSRQHEKHQERIAAIIAELEEDIGDPDEEIEEHEQESAVAGEQDRQPFMEFPVQQNDIPLVF